MLDFPGERAKINARSRDGKLALSFRALSLQRVKRQGAGANKIPGQLMPE
jgi:hypothetical protein